MKTKATIALLLSLTLAATSALADGPDWDRDDHGPGHSQQAPGHNKERQARHDEHAHYDARHFRRGERLPRDYRGHEYVVSDWHAHHLHQPPRGHEWVRMDGGFALVAITTGVIASIILNH